MFYVDYEKIVKRFNQAIERYHLNQTIISNEFFVSPKTVSAYSRGYRVMNIQFIGDFCATYGIDLY